MNEKLMTIDDLTKKTQLPKTWWYRRTRETGEGTVPRIKCGRYLRFEWDKVEEWLREQSREAQAA